LWEPNVLGAICAAGAVAWACLGARYFRMAWIGIAACLAGTLVSFTRAAWLAAIVVLAISVLGPLGRRANLGQLGLGLAVSAVIAVAAFGAEQAANYYPETQNSPVTAQRGRGLGTLILNEVDVLGRFDQVRAVLSDLGHDPLLGNGTTSYGEHHLAAGRPEHIANLELTVLNDTGVIGLAVFLAFVATFAYAAWRHRRDPVVAGLGASTLVIAITNTATETTELMVSWLLVGFLLAAIDVSARAEANPRPHKINVL